MDFLKFRPVMLGTMASALALDAVLSTAAAGDAVVDFTPPSAGGCFSQAATETEVQGGE